MTTGTVESVSAKEKLIVALDVESAKEARRLFDELRDAAGMFKVGSQLFTSAGPDFVRGLVASGARVFLDLKFHDIPNTVAAAAREAVRLGVRLFNVHAAGGGEMMRRAAEATADEAARLGVAKPGLIAVTVLTSMDAHALAETNAAASSVEEQVRRLARLADASGLDGVVASPHEIGAVRESVGRAGFLVVTPGVHPSAAAYDDQKRVMSPAGAVCAGADFVVVGRAILNAPDPVRAARAVIEEMERAPEGDGQRGDNR
ncbi:MAG: orotidine-5-phosphate decarboxylase [Acidobacteriota bacterium]|jgi:orotidine-5'-phosphate decarboxylase|nr:orotidine-5-phosphate decarboxylase [Acidobacteriota bacterium]